MRRRLEGFFWRGIYPLGWSSERDLLNLLILKKMKTKFGILALGVVLAVPCGATAALVVPGADDSDGALHVTADTTIDLSLATLGDGTTVKWDSDNTANTGNGIYDPKKWAVCVQVLERDRGCRGDVDVFQSPEPGAGGVAGEWGCDDRWDGEFERK